MPDRTDRRTSRIIGINQLFARDKPLPPLGSQGISISFLPQEKHIALHCKTGALRERHVFAHDGLP